MKLDCGEAEMSEWKKLVEKVQSLSKITKIALVGKYVELQDAYISAAEALKHAGYQFDSDIEITWLNAELVTADNAKELLGHVDGILVPGGFRGQRRRRKISRHSICP